MVRKRSKKKYDETHPKNNEDCLKEDAVQLLDYLFDHNYIIVLVTSAEEDFTSYKIKRYKLHKYFSYIVCGYEVINAKPDPEIYQKAIKEIGAAKNECIVVEDSTNGIIAAKRAGLIVIADFDERIGNDVSKADYIIHDLMEAVKIIEV